jgi:hypothetical protein
MMAQLFLLLISLTWGRERLAWPLGWWKTEPWGTIPPQVMVHKFLREKTTRPTVSRVFHTLDVPPSHRRDSVHDV